MPNIPLNGGFCILFNGTSHARSVTERQASSNSRLSGQLKVTALEMKRSTELHKVQLTNLLIQFCLCFFGFVMQDQEAGRQTRNGIPGSQ